MNGFKYYLMYTFKTIHILGIKDPSTYARHIILGKAPNNGKNCVEDIVVQVEVMEPTTLDYPKINCGLVMHGRAP